MKDKGKNKLLLFYYFSAIVKIFSTIAWSKALCVLQTSHWGKVLLEEVSSFILFIFRWISCKHLPKYHRNLESSTQFLVIPFSCILAHDTWPIIH